MAADKFRTEEFRVSGEELLAKIKQLVHEGNIRRIVIKNEEGKILIEIPLTIGVVGALLLPVWAAIGAIAAARFGLPVYVTAETFRAASAIQVPMFWQNDYLGTLICASSAANVFSEIDMRAMHAFAALSAVLMLCTVCQRGSRSAEPPAENVRPGQRICPGYLWA